MKIKLSTIAVVVAVILVLVLGGGMVASFLSSVTLPTPKIEVKKIEYFEDESNGKIVEDTVIQISRVMGATKYEIYVDEEYKGYTLDTEFSLKEIMGVDGGTYDVCVRAVREISGGDTIVSDYSKTLEVTCVAG